MVGISLFMYLSIIFNFTFLISIISLLQFFLKDSNLKLEWNFSRRIVAGVFIAAVGLFLMVTSIDFASNVQFDMRYVAFMVAATYGGPIVSLVTGITMFLANFLLLETRRSPDFIILLNTTLFFYFNVIAYQKWPRKKMYLAYVLGMVFLLTISSAVFHLWSKEYNTFLIVYIGTNVLAGYVVLNFIDYTFESLVQYRHLQVSHEIDYLTQVNNVHAFDEKLQEYIKHATSNNEQLVMLMIDLDFFKKVNDFYGHDIGDIVLFELANILKQQTRPNDIVARKGGEEFAIVLHNCNGENAEIIAERIRKAVEEFIFVKEKSPISQTISIGMSLFPDDATNSKDLIKTSDLALYLAKASGRNRVENYSTLKNAHPYIKFNRSGNEIIDSEHAELVTLFNTITSDYLNKTGFEELQEMTKSLKRHFEMHCVSEENEYSLNRVPNSLLLKHQKIHLELISLFDALLSRLNKNTDALDSEYFALLSNIIIGHIQTDDTDLFKYLKT